LRVYEGSQLLDGDSVADILSACGIDPCAEAIELSIERENRRLPAHSTLIMSYLNAHDADQATIGHLRGLSPLLDRKGGTIRLLTSKQRMSLVTQHARGNGDLARTRLSRADGRLFNDLTVPDGGIEPTPTTDMARDDTAGALE
jgi:hypothetical protein